VALFRATPRNSAAHLAVPFAPFTSCRFFDLPPASLQNLQSCLTQNSSAICPPHLHGVTLEEMMEFFNLPMISVNELAIASG